MNERNARPDEGPYYCICIDDEGICWGFGYSLDDPDIAAEEAATNARWDGAGLSFDLCEILWVTESRYSVLKFGDYAWK